MLKKQNANGRKQKKPSEFVNRRPKKNVLEYRKKRKKKKEYANKKKKRNYGNRKRKKRKYANKRKKNEYGYKKNKRPNERFSQLPLLIIIIIRVITFQFSPPTRFSFLCINIIIIHNNNSSWRQKRLNVNAKLKKKQNEFVNKKRRKTESN